MGLAATALADGASLERAASTPALDSTYAQDAIETQRDKILVIGASDGSSDVLGGHVYQGDTYAFRNNAAGTECLMYKGTSIGWVLQDLGDYIAFDAGTAVFAEGETVTGGSSGHTATIQRVAHRAGTWAGNDAEGLLVITGATGTFQDNETITSATGSATTDGTVTANALQPGGRFECKNYNFFGTSGSFRMYGVDGVSTAFEWDGTYFVPIFTGNTNDAPTHVEINEYHLTLCFEKGSLQNSGTGFPFLWSGGGAAEFGTGDELIGLQKEVGSSLIVLCRNRTFAIKGKNTVDSPFSLESISDESGGIEWTMQRIGSTRFLDDRGFTKVKAVQDYGDFDSSTYSQLIKPLIQSKKLDAVSSIIVKSKNQYRVFFNDGSCIVAAFQDNKLSGFTMSQFVNSSGSSVSALCTANGEDSDGEEVMFFGSSDGYLYQLDKGTSFDGSAVDASLILAYNNLGSPSYDKQFKKVTIEADGSAGTVIEYNVLLDYSSGRAPAGITLQETLAAGGSYWNEAIWNAFTWASEDVAQIEGNITGVGRTISLQISSSGIYVEPHTLYGLTYHYLPRKLVR